MKSFGGILREETRSDGVGIGFMAFGHIEPQRTSNGAPCGFAHMDKANFVLWRGLA